MSRVHKRILMAVIGSLFTAVSIGFFKASLLGMDPYQTFVTGLNQTLLPGMSYGTFYMLLNLVMIAGIFVVDRHHIGLVTVMGMLLIGHIVDAVQAVLNVYIPNPDLPTRILFLVFGILVMGISVSLYFTANMGVSAYDGIARILSEKKGWTYRYVRIATDIICLVVGFSLGVQVGLATLISAFCMGPLIGYFKKHFAQPLLDGELRTSLHLHRRPKLS